ncbi:hypothetical protein [Acinetobacter venetianus]|uniref:hypothetical protein n=1 Tax=Acinetobacter venetianus TaxID=52133 RepID=UPI000797C9B6|nr:hypothetical protein [Acinetobacter venetianus]KXZ66837.1 hypothetical protein AVENLUH7437_00651 [Acinetobacter venetianus]
MNDQINVLTGIIFALMIFAFLGWCMAENDNELLLQENKILSLQIKENNYAKP